MIESPLHILLVEDNPGDVRLIRELLRDTGSHGFELTSAPDLASARDQLAARPFDVVLLDLSLPDCRGLDTLAATHAQVPRMPIVILTGLDDEDTAIRALAAGAQDFLLKADVQGPLLVRALRYAIERKRIEEQLLLQSTALAAAANAIVITDTEGRIGWVNEAFCRLSGYASGEVLGLNPRLLKSGVQEPAFYEQLWKTIRAGQVWTGEVTNRRKDGSLYIGEMIITPVRQRGAVSHFIAIQQNITERRKAQEALRRSEQRFRSLIERSLDLVAILDRDGTYRYANPAHQAAYGVKPDELVGRNALEHLHPDDVRNFGPILREALQTGTLTATIEFRIRHKDGSWHTIEAIALNLLEDPDVAGVLVTGRDVTERKRTEERLRLQSSALESAANAIIITDSDGIIEWTNSAFTRLTGYASGAAVGRNPRELLKSGKQDAAFYQDMWETILAGRVWRGEIVNRRNDGSLYTELQTITPVHGVDGRISHFISVKDDITAQRQLEDHLRLAQKMEALGTLASGIAHDFNNILGAIMGNAELARLDVGSNHPASESLDEIRKAAQRARDLVQRILGFCSQRPQPRAVITLRPVVEEAMALLRATLPAGVELVTTIAKNAPSVLADPTQIHQVVMNLCTNSWQAMEGRNGRIEVCLDGVTLDAEAARADTHLRPGCFARLRVIDNGKGMDDATVERIFDPFFTTKPVGQGTGLGLSVVHGSVAAYGGSITVTSHPGTGTTFTVYLPAVQTPQSKGAPEVAAGEPVTAGGQHILYLDDEEPLVFLARRMLERLGYRVSGFTRGADGVAAVRADPAQFDLVVSDLNMPGLSGLDVARELAHLRPDLPVVLASGYVTDELRAKAAEAGVRHVIYKPNTVEELCEVVRGLTSSATTRS